MPQIILGGGLSGLSTAYYFSKIAQGPKVTLIEASNRVGGWIKSNMLKNGVIFERAARTIRPGGEAGINTLNLVEELHLSGQVVPIYNSSIVAKNRMIYANGELHLLPNSVGSLLKVQKPFSKSILRQFLQDLTAKPKIVPDESIYNFTKRRFGREVADYLISPMICGICAGNSNEISVNFLMKKLFEYEQKYGSISKGLVKQMFLDILHKKADEPVLGLLASRSKIEKWNVYTFKHGMETLSRTLETALRNFGNVDFQTNVKCTQLEFRENRETSVYLENDQKYDTSQVVSSIAAKDLASLVQSQHPDLAKMLSKIKTVTVAVVNLLYNGDLIKKPAFGFLVPPKEKLPILGVIFDSCCHQYKHSTALTVMMGGYWFKDQFGDDQNEDFLLKTATDNVRNILDISEKPVEYNVSILRDCIPQYVVGHQKNLEDIERYIKDKKLPLLLCGSSYNGVGVNDVILSAKNVAEKLVWQNMCRT